MAGGQRATGAELVLDLHETQHLGRGQHLSELLGIGLQEVRAILVTGRPIAEALRPDVFALHQAVRAVLTDAQRAWLEAHRPRRLGPPMAGMGPRP